MSNEALSPRQFSVKKWRSPYTGAVIHGTGRYESCCGWLEPLWSESDTRTREWNVGTLPEQGDDVVGSKAEAMEYLRHTHENLVASGEHDAVVESHKQHLAALREMAKKYGLPTF